MARMLFTTGVALAAVGSLCIGCSSSGSSGGGERAPGASPSAEIFSSSPAPSGGETVAPAGKCNISIDWITKRVILVTVGKPPDVPGDVMAANVQWGDGSGDSENAVGENGAVPITQDGQPVQIESEPYQHNGVYTLSAELAVLQASQIGVLTCMEVITVPHQMASAQ
ncbi:MAG TPA: hypothetical protein VLG47_07765 [Candidatus Saccharimonadales bacterium]|nr:hypothetical protein [Candidatus Saccharimonadales bacterium]